MITVWPIAAVSNSPLYSGRMLRQAGSVNKAGATATRPLGARSGVRPGTSTTTCSATSTVWTIGPHAGTLDVEVAAEAGAYDYAVDAAVTGAMTAAHATLARTDILWMRVDDPPEDSTTVPAVVAGYTANPSAGTGLPPATPARCMVIGWVNVPASGGGSPTVTWKAPFAVSAGAAIPVRTLAERDALAKYAGLQVIRLDLAGCPTETCDGTNWASPVPAISWVNGGDRQIAAGGQVAIPNTTIPAAAYPSRVVVSVEGTAGFNAAACDVAASIVSSHAVVQSVTRQVTAPAGKWVTVGRSGYVDLPAGATATIGVAPIQSVADCWFSVAMTLTRIAN